MHWQRIQLVTCTAALLNAAVGCGPTASVQVHQPHLPGVRSQMELSSQWAHSSQEPDGDVRVLLTFGLPGSMRGETHFAIYLRVPAGDGEQHLRIRDDQGHIGFFEQIRGDNRGITMIRELDLITRNSNQQCSGRFTAVCSDGTGLVGTFKTSHQPWVLESYEPQRVMDSAQTPPANVTGSELAER